MEYNLFWLRRTIPVKNPAVLVVGDSRIAEGLSARAAQDAVGNRIQFINFGMPGASPRVWYYALRDADPGRKRFSVIAIAMDRYSDEDGQEVPQNRLSDLNYLIGRLRVTDCWEFSRSYDDAALRGSVLRGCLFPGVTLRPDLLEFLSDIPARLAHAKDWRNNGAGYIAGYGGKPEDVTGLSADWVARTINLPPGLKDWQISAINATVMPGPAAQTGALTRYRQRWLGGILDLYRNSSTRIVFFEIPRAPLPIPDAKEPARFLQSIAGKPRVTILPENTFRDFERPEIFADGLHLNHIGRPLFSARLGEKLAAFLEGR